MFVWKLKCAIFLNCRATCNVEELDLLIIYKEIYQPYPARAGLPGHGGAESAHGP